MMIVATFLAAAIAQCTPVVGAERLWLAGTRWVLVGETHGTNEMPAAFTNLVCLASASGRPVTVALEYSSDWQPVIDDYLRSDGGAEARARLLELPNWHDKFQDGRSSVAVLRMLDRFRQMKKDGRIVGVIFSDRGKSTAAGQTRDASMAQAWKAIPAAKNGIILAFVGNIHAMRREMVRAQLTIVTAGSLMPPESTVTINVVADGGKAWNCQADGCGKHNGGVQHQGANGITFASDARNQWSATYELRQRTTAASPVFVPLAATANSGPVRIKAD